MTLEREHSSLQSELSVSQEELTTAREDAKRYSEQAVETQEVYERELVNHGKSMEALCTVREQVRVYHVGMCGLCVLCEEQVRVYHTSNIFCMASGMGLGWNGIGYDGMELGMRCLLFPTPS